MDLISINHLDKKSFSVKVRGHKIVADMSKDDGGEDKGLSPVELFASSLGACIGMIVYEYCAHRDIPTDEINVSVVPQLVDNPKRIANIAVDVSVPEQLEEKRRQAIMRAVKTCVIFNTIEHKTELDIEIV